MKHFILILALALGTLNALACECSSDRGLITADQKAAIANELGLLDPAQLRIEKKEGHVAPSAFFRPHSFLNRCGCTEYFYTIAQVSYDAADSYCTASVRVNNWNGKITINDLNCVETNPVPTQEVWP